MQVTNTGASNASAGSSRRKVATATSLSRFTQAISSPDWESTFSMASPSLATSASRTFFAMSFVRAGGLQLFALEAQLAVAGALLDPLLEQDQRVEHLLGPRRAAGDVDVDGDHLI